MVLWFMVRLAQRHLSLTILVFVGIGATTLRIESRYYAECFIFTPHPKRRYVGSRGDGKFDSPVPKRLSNHSPSAKHFHSVSNPKKIMEASHYFLMRRLLLKMTFVRTGIISTECRLYYQNDI